MLDIFVRAILTRSCSETTTESQLFFTTHGDDPQGRAANTVRTTARGASRASPYTVRCHGRCRCRSPSTPHTLRARHGGINTNTTHPRRDRAVTSAAARVDSPVNSPRGVRSTDARARAQHRDVVAEPHAAVGDESHALVRRVGVTAAGRLVLLRPGVACDVARDVGVGAQGGRAAVAAARGACAARCAGVPTMHMFTRLIIAPPAQMRLSLLLWPRSNNRRA